MQRRSVMFGRKASVACEACHNPSEGIAAYLSGPYTHHDCATQHMAGVPSRRRRRVLWGTGTHLHGPVLRYARGVLPQSNRMKR